MPTVAAGPKTAPLNDVALAIAAYLYPDRRGRMPQYLNVTRLRTYGGEGVLPKLFRIEDRVLALAGEKRTAWASAKPSRGEIAAFQDEVAREVLDSLTKEFADILSPVLDRP